MGLDAGQKGWGVIAEASWDDGSIANYGRGRTGFAV